MKNIIILYSVICFLSTSISFGSSSFFSFRPDLIGSNQLQYSTAALGRGGFEMAFVDSLSLNQMNYALWTSIARTTFSLSLKYDGISSKSDNFDKYTSDANFQGGFIVMPLIQNKLAFGFGLIPIVRNDYKAKGELSTNTPDNANLDLHLKGNLSEAKFAFAYAFEKDLSISLFANYTFGNIIDIRKIDYISGNLKDIYQEYQYRLYGTGFGFSGFYRINERFNTGFRVKFPVRLTAYTEEIKASTERNIEEFRKIRLPSSYTIGFCYRIDDRWFTGIDFDYQNWKNEYRIENSSEIKDINNSFHIGAGLERFPSLRISTSYLDKMNYRGGIFYNQLNVMSNNNAVNEYGLCLGVGLPIHALTNRLDLSLEMGNRGSLENNLLKEIFFRFNISLSTSELWFVQQDR